MHLIVFIAQTQLARNAGSAHAFEVRDKDSNETVVPAIANSSACDSQQERAALSAVLRSLEICADRSHVCIICGLENVVEAIQGHRNLSANADIWEEIVVLSSSKSIVLTASRPESTFDRRTISRLRKMARAALIGSLRTTLQ
jgi:hypothetical protein